MNRKCICSRGDRATKNEPPGVPVVRKNPSRFQKERGNAVSLNRRAVPTFEFDKVLLPEVRRVAPVLQYLRRSTPPRIENNCHDPSGEALPLVDAGVGPATVMHRGSCQLNPHRVTVAMHGTNGRAAQRRESIRPFRLIRSNRFISSPSRRLPIEPAARQTVLPGVTSPPPPSCRTPSDRS